MSSENTDHNGDSAMQRMIAESYEERKRAVEMVKKCIQALRDCPDMKDKKRLGLVQTIHLFWRHLPCPYTTDVGLETFSALEANKMNGDFNDEYEYKDPEQIKAEVKARVEREEAENHAEVLKELGTTDEEMAKLCGVHGWGFYPYELTQATSEDEWKALHDLRRSELFVQKLGVVYDTNHPDDRAPNHFPLVLKFQAVCIGTARLDLLEKGEGAIRLVAILKEEQRKGHGRVLEQKFEELARSMGVAKLFVNANRTAVGYYEKLGFIHEQWNDPTARATIAFDCVQMTKVI